ncbi:GAF domain-containing protein [Flavobacteriaceae bacterium D16]|nr:GAF domain-containing protein [Flavobacteriaceae bacterium D16]
MHRLLLLFIVLLYFHISVVGQRFQYITYQGDEVPFQKVNEVTEDHKGYIWLATDQGLFRFDGQTFEDYNTTLESRYIKSFARKDRDTLLFSNDSGIFKHFYQDNKVAVLPLITREDLEGRMEYPTQIFWDSKQRLWAGQLNGSVYRYEILENKSAQMDIPAVDKSPHMVFDEDQYGHIWVVVSGKGLYRYDEQQDKLIAVKGYEGAEDLWIEGNRIIVVGRGVYDISVDEQGRIRKSTRAYNSNMPFTLISNNGSGRFFLVAESGIFTLDADLKHIKVVYGSNDPHRVEQLPYTGINDLYFSTDPMQSGGTLWVGTDSTLGLLYTSYFKSVSGMAHDNILGMVVSGPDEVLISQGNVYKVNTEDMTYNQLPGLNRITAMATFGNRRWYATSEGTIKAYDGNKVLREYDLSYRGGGIFYMQADHKGEIWFCQAPLDKPIKGLAKIKIEGSIREYGEADGFQSRILVADEGGREELYVGGIGENNYLYTYNRQVDGFTNVSLPFPFEVSRNFEVHDLAVDNRGLVWIGTTDGLLRYDTERIQRIPLGPYTTSEVRSVCAMPDGSLWLATDTDGLLHLDRNLNYVLFDEASGTPSKIAAYRSLLVDNQNILWAGTAEGAVHSSIANPKPLVTVSPILKSVYVDGTKKKQTTSLKFSKNNVLRFRFTSLTFPGEEIKYQYKYFTEGFTSEEIEDLEWLLVAGSGEIRLKDLKSGHYTLQVRAQEPGGYSWSEPGLVAFEIRKSWYVTPLGIAGIVLIAGLFFWYGLRLWVIGKTKQLKRALLRKERELSKKEQELATQIGTLKEQRQELKSAGVTIYLLSRLMRQIPPRATWKEVLPVLCKLVELPTGMDAFELAFESGNDMRHYGFKKGQKAPQKRAKEFNEKDDLTSYVLTNKKPILIHNIDREAGQYINHQDNKGFHSRIYVPFKQVNGAEAVLCVYGKEKNRFVQRDMTVLQILATFLSVNVIDELR